MCALCRRLSPVALLLLGFGSGAHAQGANTSAGAAAFRNLAVSERLREVNETLLPESARAMNSGVRSVAATCIDEALAGASPARDQGRDGATAAGGGIALCGGGEYLDLHADSGAVPVDWSGLMRSAHAGGGIVLQDSLVLGAAVSRFDGRIDYRDRRGGGAESRHKTRMLGIHPYLGWSWSEHARAWAVGGYSWGETDLEDFSAGSLLRAESDSSLATAAAGGSLLLLPRWACGPALDLKAELWTSWLDLDGNGENIEKTEAEINGVRVALEGSLDLLLGNGGKLRPALGVGMRRDGGDGAGEGLGMETLAGFRYAQGRWNMNVHSHILLFREGDVKEWGATAALALQTGAGGRGWSAGLETGYGALGGGAARPWESGAPSTSAAAAPEEAALRLRAAAGYGMGLGRGLVTPYGALEVDQEDARVYSLGARAQLGSDLSLHVKGERQEYADRNADQRLWVGVGLRF